MPRTKVPKRVTAYHHPNPEPVKQEADPQPGRYFVTVRRETREGLQHVPLAGPFPTHQEALDMVDRAKALACEMDPRGVWYAYGTCREIAPNTIYPGVLNEKLDLPKEGLAA